MESVAQSDALIRLAFVSGLAATAFTVVVLFWMTALRLFTRYRSRSLDRQSRKWLDILIEGRQVVDADLSALPRLTAFVLMRQWIAAVEQSRSLQDSRSAAARHEQLCVAADHARVEEFALRLLEQGRKLEVMSAAIALGFLKASRAWIPLRRYLRSADHYISVACAEALVRIDPARALPELVEAIPERREWPEHVLSRIFRQLDSSQVEFVIKSLAQADDYDAMLRIYRALERNNDERTQVVLEWLFKNARREADVTECIYGSLQEHRLQSVFALLEEYHRRVSVLTAVAKDIERSNEELTIEKLLSKEPPLIRDHVLRRLGALDELELTSDT